MVDYMHSDKFLFLIQARLGSSRLPKKVLKPIFRDMTLLEVIYKRTLMAKYATERNVIVLTTNNPCDDLLVEWLVVKGIRFFRGEEHNVFNRFKDFLLQKEVRPEYFFRICSDNPFLEPLFIDEMCDVVINSNKTYDYVSFKDLDGTPIIKRKYGLFCEMINTNTLIDLDNVDSDTKENVSSFLYSNEGYRTKYLDLHGVFFDFSLCVDTEIDYFKVSRIMAGFENIDFSYENVLFALGRV
jgi:spore coat polysaccharide biosynthesis protein SpsF (cytidylyltransferase family)